MGDTQQGDDANMRFVFVSCDGAEPTPVEFEEGLTVGEVLDRAGIVLDDTQQTTVNGRRVRQSARAVRGSTIIVLDNVSGG